ncbi:hypothetical protein RB195_012063 [Necator americanus]|uniref:Uncharacterized protein n=2 Tax=Necator americanus TaxID=51031 RepID=A0ABR1D6Z4_NECAM|nr:hypothetical protein NECAME_06315 [Necator americanus]ETN85612.1 hypothetical protein NECAME_06315 [Necator americanus]
MIRLVSFFAITYVTLGCGPAPGTPPQQQQSAVVGLFTDENFDPAQADYYRTLAINLMKNVFESYGIPYVDNWAQISSRDDGGKVTIDVRIPSIDCQQLHQLVTLLKNEIFLIEYAGYRCGSNPIVYVR